MGRLTIKLTGENVEKYIKENFNPNSTVWLYSDTDSCYFSAADIIDFYNKKQKLTHEQNVKLLDRFYTKKIDPIVNKTIKELSNFTNMFDENVQGADREVIGKALLIAKKKYTMLVYDNEGVHYTIDNPYIKTQGLELIKGGTPEFSKKYLKEAIPVLMNKSENDVRLWFKEIKSDFLNWPLDKIAKTQGVSKIYDSEWRTIKNGRKVSIPFGSRVAIISNNYIKENNLQTKFQLIQPGDKVKMLYLKEPNPLKSDAFGFLEVDFANMFKDYVDYDKNFDKFFLSPLEIMTKAMKLNITNTAETLDEW